MQLVDCSDRPVTGFHLRIYRSVAPTCGALADVRSVDGSLVIEFIDGSFSELGELVTIEAVGRDDVGQPYQVLAREQIRMRSNTISALRMPPLRADSPPVP